jgi:hypothetical protein
VAVKRGSR